MRARQALETTINGDAEGLDAATRRGLLTLADHIDELRSDIDSLRKTVLGTGAGIVTTLLAAAISVIVR